MLTRLSFLRRSALLVLASAFMEVRVPELEWEPGPRQGPDRYLEPGTAVAWVDAENGNDAHEGSSLNPFRTLSRALEHVPLGGGTIMLIGPGSIDLPDDALVDRHHITFRGALRLPRC